MLLGTGCGAQLRAGASQLTRTSPGQKPATEPGRGVRKIQLPSGVPCRAVPARGFTLPSPPGKLLVRSWMSPQLLSSSQEVFAASTAPCQEDEGHPEASCPCSCRQSYSPMSFGCHWGSEARRHSPGTPSPAPLLPRPHTQQSRLPRRVRWSLFTGHASGCSSSISPRPPRRSDSAESI